MLRRSARLRRHTLSATLPEQDQNSCTQKEKQQQRQTQIPFGNDNKGNDNKAGYSFSGSALRLLLALLLLTGLSARAQELTAPYPGKGVFTTTGNWQFHTGDDLAWASPGFNDSGWKSISADEPLGAQGYPGYHGFAWYRRAIDITNVTGPISIYLPEIDNAYELYFNGRRIGGFGQLPPHAVFYFTNISNVFPLPRPDASGHLKGVLAIRVLMFMLPSFSDPLDQGGFNGPPRIGDSRLLTNTLALQEMKVERSGLLRIIECAVLFLVAAIALGMWAFDRRRKLHLWLGVFLLGFVEPVYSRFPDLLRLASSNWYSLWTFLSYATTDLGIWMLILVLFGLDREKLWRRTTAILAAVYLLAWAGNLMAQFYWTSGWPPLRSIEGVTRAIYYFLPAYLFVLLAAGLRRRRDLTLLPTVLACAALEAYALVVSTLSLGVRFTHLDAAKLIAAATIHLGPYNFNLFGQLEAIILIVLVATIYREQIRERNRQLFVESELKSAAEIQSILVPEDTPAIAGLAVASVYKPAAEVGGDFFQIVPLEAAGEEPSTLVVVGDVSGKGLKAAMTVSLIVGAIRTLADLTRDPAEVLAGINRRLIGRTQGGFATCVALRIDPNGDTTLANAGHLPPFRDGKELPVTASLPLGLTSEAEYENMQLRLQENETLTFMTDGVLEARNPTGELYGFDRLASLMAAQPNVHQVVDAACNFGQEDDITVVSVTRTTLRDLEAITSGSQQLATGGAVA